MVFWRWWWWRWWWLVSVCVGVGGEVRSPTCARLVFRSRDDRLRQTLTRVDDLLVRRDVVQRLGPVLLHPRRRLAVDGGVGALGVRRRVAPELRLHLPRGVVGLLLVYVHGCCPLLLLLRSARSPSPARRRRGRKERGGGRSTKGPADQLWRVIDGTAEGGDRGWLLWCSGCAVKMYKQCAMR